MDCWWRLIHGIPNNKLHIQPTPVRKLLNKKYPSYGLIRQWCQVAYRFIKHPATRSTKTDGQTDQARTRLVLGYHPPAGMLSVLSGLRRTKRPLLWWQRLGSDRLLRLLCRDKEQRVLKESHRPARLHLLRVVGRTGRWNLLVRTEKGIKEYLLERTCNGSLHEALQVDQR